VAERRGHIKIARKFFDTDPWWNKPRVYSEAEAWLDLIQLAAYRSTSFATLHGPLNLERGQLVASLRHLATRWKWSVKRVRGFLTIAQRTERIRAQRETQHGTLYLIENYDHYQTGGTAEGTPEGTEGYTGRAQGGHKIKQLSSKAEKNTPSWVAEFGVLWRESRDGKPPYGRIGNAVAELIAAHGRRQVRAAWVGYLADRKGKPYATAEDFAQNYGIYRDKHAQVSNDTGDGWVPIPDEPEAAA
jgi:hypothetical protein